MKRTRGQNTGTANGVQGIRSKYCHPSHIINNINTTIEISSETQDSQPLPANMSDDLKNDLSSETIGLIRALREANEDDIYCKLADPP